MKALTVCQPFAALIMSGAKLVENRKWRTDYRGPLVIHAGKSKEWLPHFDWDGPPLVFGAALGFVHVVACFELDELMSGDLPREFDHLITHEHTEGPWCWVLDDPRLFPEPIPYNGAQQLWMFPDRLVPAEMAR